MSNREIDIEVGEQLWRVMLIGYPVKNHKLIAQPVDHHSGWDMLIDTPLNERTVFKCRTCGRESNTPDKVCATAPIIDLTEHLVECRHRFRKYIYDKNDHGYVLTCVSCGGSSGVRAEIVGKNEPWMVIDMDEIPAFSALNDISWGDD